MRLITFRYQENEILTGVLKEDQIYPLPWADLVSAIEAGADAIFAAAAAAQPIAMDDAEILAPVQHPGKIMAIGLNYLDHCLEQGLTPPDRPTLFTKFPTSVNDPGGEIRWDPALTQMVDYEAELAVVIGKRARRVQESDAYNYVFGYTCLNDVSARDLQKADGQWVRAKSLDTFCPIGPVVVTADELSDPHNLTVKSWVNGELRQSSNTKHLIHNVPKLVAFLSAAFTLEPGDIITTGTPGGVGLHRDPPTFLEPGDHVVVEIEQIGRLENIVGPYLT
jgi:2-keto-4-pentenoate hydratase/2-oxohepta-3-ene-1,7-dioic acid hydratase in catechol pathway